MRIGKYKLTPALIVAFLVVIYSILHWLGIFREIIKHNQNNKAKIEYEDGRKLN
jgi:hypothetical protein